MEAACATLCSVQHTIHTVWVLYCKARVADMMVCTGKLHSNHTKQISQLKRNWRSRTRSVCSAYCDAICGWGTG